MRQRCLCTTSVKYNDYGGRGIAICNEWSSFNNFREWALSHGYRKGLTIERINNDGNYEQSNCRWATMAEQNHNSRQTKLTIEKVKEIRQDNRSNLVIAKEYDVSHQRIGRIKRNEIWRST
jgi:hypothetical protein